MSIVYNSPEYGFEPSLEYPESPVLPLDDPRIYENYTINKIIGNYIFLRLLVISAFAKILF